jgi:hypothetical protein
MGKTLTAVFDGQVLRPDSPADLKPNARYQVTMNEKSRKWGTGTPGRSLRG